MAYAQGSAEHARMPAPQPMRLPEEDRSWAQNFLNQWESADDADGQRQVYADYSNDFPDSRRRKALGNLVIERLTRKAEIERMNPIEQLDRMAQIESSPLVTGTEDNWPAMPGPADRQGNRTGPGEVQVAAWPLAAAGAGGLDALLGALTLGGIITYEAQKSQSGKTAAENPSEGRITPARPPAQIPPFPAGGAVDAGPSVTPLPDRQETPVLPGGGPVVPTEPSPFPPPMLGEVPYYTRIEIVTKSGKKYSLRSFGGERAQEKLQNFLEEIPGDELADALVDILDDQKVDTTSGGEAFANVVKSGGEKKSLEDFHRLREAYGLSKADVKPVARRDIDEMKKFQAPDGTEIMWRRVSDNNKGKTVELHVKFPKSLQGQKVEGKKFPRMKIRYGD
tara:strand:+ start:590 stop:1771 length:1182 start_codon:yes stop_codon:yes gene_type:complete